MELENTTNVGAPSTGTGPDASDVELESTESEPYLNLNLLWKDLQEIGKDRRETVLEEALKEAKRILEEDEHSWKAHQFAGKFLLEKGEFEEALKHISRARAIHPGSDELRHLYKSCKSLVEVHVAEDVESDEALTMSGRYEIKDIHSKRLSFARKPEDAISSSKPGEDDVLQGHRLFLGLDRCPQNFEEAARQYTKAAEVNNTEGVYCLALLNIIGKGVKKDFANGKRLLEKAAHLTPGNDIGVIAARLYLGLIFHIGVSTATADDIMQAAELYRKALEGGCDRAANNLGVLLFREVGKTRARELAETCWKIAVQRGNTDAPLSLTLLYFCEYDSFAAVKMLNKAVPLDEGIRLLWKIHLMDQFREKATLSKEIETFETSQGLKCDHLSFIERKRRLDESKEDAGKEPPTGDPEDDFIPDCVNLLVAKKPSPELWKGLSPQDPVDPKPYDLKKLEERSKQGSVTAHKILHELKEISAVTNLWKKCGQGREDITPENRVALIEALYNCYIEDCFGECQEPEDPNFCKFLEDMLTTHGNEKSDLDRKIRVCYGNLSNKQDPFRKHIVQEGMRRYPEEVPMCRLVFVLDWKSQDDIEKALETVSNGMDHAPKDLSLLLGRALLQLLREGRNSNMSSEAADSLRVTERFQTFVNEAPEDHPLLPSVFYFMAYAHIVKLESAYKRMDISDATVWIFLDYCWKIQYYLKKGEAAEKKVPTELSQDSLKQMLTDRQCAVFRVAALFQSKQSKSRVKLVKRHRRLLMQARSRSRYTKKESPHNDKIQADVICADLQKLKLDALTKKGRNLKAISLEEMYLIGKHTYEGGILSLTLVEDPVWIDATSGSGPGFVQVIAKDDNGEWLEVHVHTDPELDFERVMEFGSKFFVINPCLQQFANGARFLQVQNAEENVIENGRVDDMCRCCGQENASATRACGNCKLARYCSRTCQEADWKQLGHRLICDPK